MYIWQLLEFWGLELPGYKGKLYYTDHNMFHSSVLLDVCRMRDVAFIHWPQVMTSVRVDQLLRLIK